jgi:hypothetical protein
MEDGVFIAYIVISALTFIYLVSDFLEFTSGITAILLLVPSTGITLIWIYVLFLLILVPRRFIDKRKGLTKDKKVNPNESDLKAHKTFTKFKLNSRNKYLAVAATVLLLFSIATLSGAGKTDFEREADDFFNKQQKISSVLNSWNKESALLLGIIQKNSSSEYDYSEAMYALNDVTGRITPILSSLREECADVPSKSLDQTGEAQASALSWNMLKVTCDLVPLQFTEYLSIFNAQISEDKTQADVDYHVQRLTDFGNQRRQAGLQAMEELEKYATGSQLEQIRVLKKLFE